MDYNKLAELLFPNVTETPEDMEKRYPPRVLPEGAKVTRFAPSPTGFVHFGGLFPTIVGERLAHQSGGVFYLRIEDTDSKREVEGAAEALIRILAHYGIYFDEGAVTGGDSGDYGPYRQSQRADIYHVYAKKLVLEGKAYPVFSDAEQLDAIKSADKKSELKNTDWEKEADSRREAMLKRREFTLEQVEKELSEGHAFALFAIADGNPKKRIKVTDLIRGDLEIPECDEDVVLLKSDGIPTYHFAHAVDDHLMRTTHVIRGEEWLPSLATHLMLFRYLGFKPPKYMHIANLMHICEDGSKKKLSKRDMGANMEDYKRLGFAPECVVEYVMTLLNSNYEEWHAANPDKPYTDFPFNIKKMSNSGCLFDMDKLGDISRNVVSRFTAERVYNSLLEWAEEFDEPFALRLKEKPDYALSVISIGRGGKKPRKDYGTWTELREYMSLFYDDTFKIVDTLPDTFDKNDITSSLGAFVNTYDPSDDQNAWFGKIKEIASSLGYAADMKEYKANPENFKGSVADISSFIRVAVTGKLNSPDLFTVMNILGSDRVIKRINSFMESIV